MNKKNRFVKMLALALVIALSASLMSVGIGLGEVAPAQPALAAALMDIDEPQAEDELTEDDYLRMEEEAAAQEEADDVIEEPSEELQFLDELIGEIDLPDNALDAVNGMTNILLVGIDARRNEKTGRSDTMIIATLDSNNNCIKLTSFMRDLYVEIPGRKGNRLNAAYVFGGADLLKKTLTKNFGIDIDYYVTVRFDSVADIVDQLGGMTINVEKKYLPRVNAVIKMDNKSNGLKINSGLVAEPGEQVLTGRQTLAYARYRYGDPQGDAGRTARQREVILKLLDIIKDKSLIELAQLALSNLDKVETDMSIADMLRLAPAAFQLKDSDVKQLRIPIDGSYSSQRISGMAVYVPNRNKNKKALADFILEG
ncbi:LCP family protein, partial [Eubacteriales bacterium OttesenSCG-928-N13]|nr:LCP family protein [Eubacteriales bacterium OttesenSCG-928-N13]